MILTETHLHTCISSSCGYVHPSDIVPMYKEAGYGAIVVTDHYIDSSWRGFDMEPDIWLAGYHTMCEYGKEAGIRIFLGMELRFGGAVEDFLVYGFDEDFLRKNRYLYSLTQAEAFELFDAHDILMYQAHPYRTWQKPADPAYLHGVEIYNGHPRHNNNNPKAEAFAHRHGLLGIAGSDFHQVPDVGHAGIYMDEQVQTGQELALYMREQVTKDLMYFGGEK